MLSLKAELVEGDASSHVVDIIFVDDAPSFWDVLAAIQQKIGSSEAAGVGRAELLDRVPLTYVDDDGDTITVCSEAEWHEALNFRVGGIMYVRCEVEPQVLRPMTPAAAPEAAAVAPAAQVVETAAHPDAGPANSCRAIPRRVSRAMIMRRNPNYEFKGTPENMPPVIRDAAPAEDEDRDDWEEIKTETEAPSMWEMVTGSGASTPEEPAMPSLEGAASTITLKVNGVSYTVPTPEPEMKLVDFLRKEASCGTGSKIGCGEGGCGACTVLLHLPDPVSGKPVTKHINSCLRPLCSCDGLEVSTVESVGSQESGLHPVQKQLADNNGSQCGFCTPGWVMAMMGLLAKNPKPSHQQVEDHFDGNICRCTGYRPILETMQGFAEGSAPDLPAGCCKAHAAAAEEAPKPAATLAVVGPTGSQWLRPQTLQEALQMKAAHGASARLVGGNTGIGVEKYYNEDLAFDAASVYIDIARLKELAAVQPSASGKSLLVGSAVPINDLVEILDTAHKAAPASTVTFPEISRHCMLIANNQVRNVGTWAGNLMIAAKHPDFPSDLMTTFSGAGCSIHIVSSTGKRIVSIVDFAAAALNGDALKDEEMIQALEVPHSPGGGITEVFDSWKIMPRHQNAHAYVNGACRVHMDASKKITDAVLTFGGLGPGLRVAAKTCAYLKGKSFSAATLEGVLPVLAEDCKVSKYDLKFPGVVHADAYRESLCLNLFYKFVLAQLDSVPARLKSAVGHYQRAISKGAQTFTPNNDTAPLACPVTKLEAYSQATGEAKYTDDIPQQKDELCAAYVYSRYAAGVIASIDASEALKMQGVVDFISAKDVTDMGCANECGGFPGDEEIFASKQVYCAGQAVGLIVADRLDHAQAAAKKVVVNLTPLPAHPILSVDEAIAANSFLENAGFDAGHVDELKQGDCDKGFAAAAHVASGTVKTGAQEHFYMETMASVAVPEEDGRWTVHSSAQGPASIRQTLTGILQIPGSRINVITKRAGGGFGGKITRSHPIAASVVVAAKKLKRPVRMQLDRNTDIIMTGKRHPYQNQYKVGFDANGKITTLQMTFYAEGGYNHDASLGCMDMCMMWADSAYNFTNYHISNKVCKTNFPSNTATRTPGAAQGIFTTECVMEHVAHVVGKPVEAIRQLNFYKEGDMTPYGEKLIDFNIPDCWSGVQTAAGWTDKLASVEAFNKANRWRKRGASMIPVKYGAGDPGFMSGCILNAIGEDGSVSVSTTGVEIGQGLYTKVAQAVAYKLKIPLDTVTVLPTETAKMANFGDTGGSATSESSVQAALFACEDLLKRLAPFMKPKEGKPATFLDGVQGALKAGLPLTAYGYYNGDKSGNMKGSPTDAQRFTYFVYAAAVAVTELDVLTGQVEVLSMDIVYDNGISLNPKIDIGQIEGGLVMSMGWHLTEEIVADSSTGVMKTNGTWGECLHSKAYHTKAVCSRTKRDRAHRCSCLSRHSLPAYLLALLLVLTCLARLVQATTLRRARTSPSSSTSIS